MSTAESKFHVHVVGVSPRTGTTLMMELFVSCFEFDGWANHELNYFFAPKQNVPRYCSKATIDLEYAQSALKRRSDLWFICMVRDPRDTVVSRHREQPDAYWAYLGISQRRISQLRKASTHPRFLVVRYEDLVSDPDGVQDRLATALPFLKRKHQFSQFHTVASPSSRSVRALSGVRKIGNESIGRWREELPRLKAQLEKFGEIDEMLKELGYEDNGNWKQCLQGIDANNGISYLEKKHSILMRLKRKVSFSYYKLRHDLGVPIKRGILTATEVQRKEAGAN